MNNDLISRSALLESMNAVVFRNVSVEHQLYVQVACEAFDAVAKTVPTVDAVEVVRHGKYGFVGPHIGSTYSPYAEHGTCSECKERILIDPRHKNYCPNCGSKMDAEVEG